MKKISIKREQSQAGLSFAEREKFRPQVKNKLLLLLVLLVAVVSGAWAADDIKAYSNPTATDVKTVWDAIDAANSANFKFDYEDYTYVPEFIQDVWYLQLQMADPANRTAEKAPSIRNHKRFADALRFLKARAMLDSSIDYVDYWK